MVRRGYKLSILSSALLCVAQTALAQAYIERPGAHPRYGLEVEPHGLVQWAQEPGFGDEGIGVGIRFSIPVIENGPIPSINNNFAIGFGLDWAHFDDLCFFSRGYVGPLFVNVDGDCSADDFWVPVDVQWNFFFSEMISAFPELGLAIRHTRVDGVFICNGAVICDDTVSDTDLDAVFWLGMRVHFSPKTTLTFRLGTPSLTVGLSLMI